MKTLAVALVAVYAAWIGWWLIDDSMTFFLEPADPVTGRVRGCYSFLERLMGATRPSELRHAQTLIGVTLLLGGPMRFVTRARARVHAWLRRREAARDPSA